LAFVSMIAYAANFTPFGITLFPIATATIGWTVLFSLIALVRRAGISPEDRYGLTSSIAFGVLPTLFTVNQRRRAGDSRGAF
ncbi:DUF1616 domain-containing protein, partial [Aeromonas jandaei]|uniref:DUF1616 domain-containing protein n=1 Tax=Aeromonas jandaei TaxID=650 RepID=UPI0038B4F816